MINTPIYFALQDTIDREDKYIPSEHLLLLEKKLLKIYNGELKRLIVSMPPRHGKSHLISEYFPFWWLLNRPDDKIIMSSYSLDLAEEYSIKAKEHFIEYGKTKDLRLKINTNSHWTIKDKKGGLTAVGVGGSITGKGANLFVIDDPVKNSEEALSNVYRNKVYRWYQSTATTRLEPDGAMIVVMTRWHHDDLAGRIINEMKNGGEVWEVLELPAIAGDDDPLGRKKGEALFPERFDYEALMRKKSVVGSYFFNAMYQQKPIDNENRIFNESWWQYYDEEKNFAFKIQVWDTAFEKGKENDYSVCATWGWKDEEFYLIDLFREKLQFPELQTATLNQYEKHKPSRIFIEDAGSGKALIQTLRKQTKLNISEIATLNKIVRAHTATPHIEMGKVFLPRGKSFIDDFISEHNQFPADKHDDIVDTTTMAIQILSQYHKPTKIKKSINLNKRKDKYSNY